MQISHTMASCWRRCRRRFLWRYVDCWRPNKEAVGLQRGSLGHLAMAHYLVHHNMPAAIQHMRQEADPATSEDLLEQMAEVLLRYAAWAPTTVLDQSIERVLYTEMREELDVGNGHTLVFIIDGVFQRKDGTVWLWENKFNKRASVGHVANDAQIGWYTMAFRRKHGPCSGVAYNVVRMADGPTARKEPALRQMCYRSPDGDGLTWVELQQQLQEINTFLNRLKAPQQERLAYRNPTKDCSWDCDYQAACIALQEDGSPDLVFKSQFHRADEEYHQRNLSDLYAGDEGGDA
jgi:hypothetical protein